jgi:hypothetical protein
MVTGFCLVVVMLVMMLVVVVMVLRSRWLSGRRDVVLGSDQVDLVGDDDDWDVRHVSRLVHLKEK